MGQINGTLSTGNNSIATASNSSDSVSIDVSADVTIAFGEAATANSFPLLGSGVQTFSGRSYTTKNVNLYSAAGGETYKIIW